MSDIDIAAKSLHDNLHKKPWFTCVGVGDNAIFIYGDPLPNDLPKEWQGFEVKCVKMGIPIAGPFYPKRSK